jgi:hypothetical protein
MSNRVQVILGDEEREIFRRRATAEGMSLSAWLREAGRRRLAEETPSSLDSVDELRRFFEALPDAEGGREPDWEQHLAVIQASRSDGAASS